MPARRRLTAPAFTRATLSTAIVAVVAVPLYALMATAVGLNGDLQRYGEDGVRLLCGEADRVWSNYRFEPVFVALWQVLSIVWGMTLGPGSVAECQPSTADVYSFAVFGSVTLVALLIWAVRHLGPYALCFHLLLCTDTVLMMLPFNLVRQFAAMVVVVGLTIALVRGRLSTRAYTLLLLLAALIHWSAWLLFGAAVAAFAAAELSGERLSRMGRRQMVAPAIAIAIVAAGYLSASVVASRVETINLARLLDGITLQAAVRGLFSPVTLAVTVVAAAVARSSPEPFIRVFVMVAGVMYFACAASGHVGLMERARATTLPVTYLLFLVALSRRRLAREWEFVNVSALLLSMTNYLYHQLVLQPFADRPGFLSLFE